MTGFFILGVIATLLIACGGAFAWRRTGRNTPGAARPPRTRDEARRLQTRFDEDDDFTRNFHRPTQNEVLETLQTLDHLTPLWDQGEEPLVARRLKNELAESFPTLRKSGCGYPQAIEEDSALLPGHTKLSPDALDAQIRRQTDTMARARADFQAARAHANALHQLTSGPETGPVALAAGSLPFRVSGEPVTRRPAPVAKLLGASALALCLASAGWYFTLAGQTRKEVNALSPSVVNDDPAGAAPAPSPVVDPTLGVETAVDTPASVEPTPETSAALASASSPAAGLPPLAAASPATPPPVSPEMLLARRIEESKLRAIDKHPDLVVPNSELNLRFVFRYKNLLTEKSPRLRDPQWPEQFADECARATEGESRRKKPAQATARS